MSKKLNNDIPIYIGVTSFLGSSIKQDSLVWWNQDWTIWPECQASSLHETWHNPYGEAWRWQHHAAGMCSSGRDWETSQGRGKSEQSKVLRDPWWKHCSRALKVSDWGEGSPSNRTMTLSTKPRQHRSGLGTNLWMSLSGPDRAWTWTSLERPGNGYTAMLPIQPGRTWEHLQRIIG
jgi:hypothetical protein